MKTRIEREKLKPIKHVFQMRLGPYLATPYAQQKLAPLQLARVFDYFFQIDDESGMFLSTEHIKKMNQLAFEALKTNSLGSYITETFIKNFSDAIFNENRTDLNDDMKQYLGQTYHELVKKIGKKELCNQFLKALVMWHSQMAVEGCQAKVISSQATEMDKKKVLALRQIMIIHLDDHYKIGFCNNQGKYEEKTINPSSVPQFLMKVKSNKSTWYLELDEDKDAINTILKPLKSKIFIMTSSTTTNNYKSLSMCFSYYMKRITMEHITNVPFEKTWQTVESATNDLNDLDDFLDSIISSLPPDDNELIAELEAYKHLIATAKAVGEDEEYVKAQFRQYDDRFRRYQYMESFDNIIKKLKQSPTLGLPKYTQISQTIKDYILAKKIETATELLKNKGDSRYIYTPGKPDYSIFDKDELDKIPSKMQLQNKFVMHYNAINQLPNEKATKAIEAIVKQYKNYLEYLKVNYNVTDFDIKTAKYHYFRGQATEHFLSKKTSIEEYMNTQNNLSTGVGYSLDDLDKIANDFYSRENQKDLILAKIFATEQIIMTLSDTKNSSPQDRLNQCEELQVKHGVIFTTRQQHNDVNMLNSILNFFYNLLGFGAQGEKVIKQVTEHLDHAIKPIRKPFVNRFFPSTPDVEDSENSVNDEHVSSDSKSRNP